MSIRKGDDSKEFRKALQNPPRPINNTSASPEMEKYLKDMNDGTLKSEETKKKEEAKKKQEAEDNKYTLFCPTCRRPTLKRAPQGYSCGYCGLHTNSPLRMAVDEAAKEQQEKK